ncbi:MAG: PEP-CTERM sorting domain-containing protein [Microcystaceae cyanobacterium]
MKTAKILVALVTGSISSLILTTDAQAFVIESFTDAQSLMDTLADGNPNDTEEDPVNPIGGGTFFGTTRVFEANVTQANAGSELEATIDAGGNANLNISSGVNILGDVSLNYTGGGPFDITDGGVSDAFEFLYAGSDFPTNATITATDSQMNVSTLNFQTLLLAMMGETQLIPLTSFVGTADLTDLTMLDINFGLTAPNTDLQIGFIETVDTDPPTPTPEPATLLGLAAFGLAGLASRRLKK